MAENIGVLELEIRDNASDAGQGLNSLATALSSVKQAVGKGLGLGTASRQISGLVASVGSGSKALNSIGNMLTAVRQYADAFKEANGLKFNTQPIDDLKAAIGDGIKIGQAGTQLNNLRTALESEWNTDNAYNAGMALSAIGEGAKSLTGTSLGKKANEISAVARALSEYADAAVKVQSAVGAGQTSIDVGKNVGEGAAQGIEGQQGAVESAAFALANAIINTIKNQLDEHSPSKVTEEQGKFAGLGLANGLIESKGEVQKAAEEVANAVRQTLYGKLNVMEFARSPVENMLDAFRPGVDATNNYKNAVGAVLPKVQELSSEEMLVAGHARMATEAIGRLISQLEKKPNWKGFSDVVDTLTGVSLTSDSNNKSLINEQTTMFTPLEEVVSHSGTATEGIVKIYDAVSGAYKDVYTDGKTVIDTNEKIKDSYEEVADPIKNAIDLTTVPASGKNGVFANAAEEAKYLTEQIEVAKQSQQQFNDIAAMAEKQLKYGGPIKKPELEFNLQHSTEGYYQAVEAEEQYKSALADLASYASEYVRSSQEMAQASMQEAASTSSAADAASSFTNYADGMVGLLWRMGQAMHNVGQGLNNFRQRLSILGWKLHKIGMDLRDVMGDFRNLGAGIKDMFPTLAGLIKRFKSMAIMRAMRYIIRQISAGFREGVENVYHYSKAVGTDIAPAMDQGATALQQMKNSIGAAVAPAIQALVPLLQTVVNGFITLINYVNQFFALMRGQSTWTRALPEQAEAFEKSTKSAKDSSKAMKDLLADWDELNIIQSQGNSGSGSGTGKTDKEYSQMFEEVSEYNNEIRSLVENIKEQFGDVWSLAKRIAMAVLGWKFSRAFSGILGILGGLIGSAVTIGLVFDISTLFTKQFLDTGNPGWLIGDILTTLAGGVLAKKILSKVLGGTLAKIALPLTFMVSATASIIALVKDTDVSALSEKSVLASANAAIEAGIGVGTALYSLGGFTAGLSAGAGLGMKTISKIPLMTCSPLKYRNGFSL